MPDSVNGMLSRGHSCDNVPCMKHTGRILKNMEHVKICKLNSKTQATLKHSDIFEIMGFIRCLVNY